MTNDPATSGREVHCPDCRHYRHPARPQFSPPPGNARGIREYGEWQQHEKAVEQGERTSFEIGAQFFAPPQFFEWCRAWTDRMARDAPRDHAGRATVIYVLCARQNPNRNCALFEPGPPDRD